MWRFFHRERFKLAWPRNSGALFTGLLAVTQGWLLGFGSEVSAQEEWPLIAAQANHSIVVREHAGWNRSCEAIAHPALYLSEPPHHGQICARVENIKISSMYVGTESQCIGRLVRGVRLIYRPDAAYAGDDSLRYAAQYPSVLRAIQVQVTVAANAASAMPSNNIGAPIEPARQAPGPIPDCAEPIF